MAINRKYITLPETVVRQTGYSGVVQVTGRRRNKLPLDYRLYVHFRWVGDMNVNPGGTVQSALEGVEEFNGRVMRSPEVERWFNGPVYIVGSGWLNRDARPEDQKTMDFMVISLNLKDWPGNPNFNTYVADHVPRISNHIVVRQLNPPTCGCGLSTWDAEMLLLKGAPDYRRYRNPKHEDLAACLELHSTPFPPSRGKKGK